MLKDSLTEFLGEVIDRFVENLEKEPEENVLYELSQHLDCLEPPFLLCDYLELYFICFGTSGEVGEIVFFDEDKNKMASISYEDDENENGSPFVSYFSLEIDNEK